mmetsp:Transcript_38743/g.92567  ORF Transcript_38743/g.92567 Transcript_38743/m.92567 type:complete len:454 (+) Transcript_38743:65-1426(+)
MAAEPSLSAKCLAEFLGTFLLVFTVVCNVTTGSSTFAGLSIGAVLFVAIQAFGKISGANFNPAVSVALGCIEALGSTGLTWNMVGIYCGCQVLGGVCAATLARLICGKAAPLAVTASYSLMSAGMCELFYTFMLCFVVLNVAAAKKNKEENGQYFALAIGFCVVAGAYGAGFISGGAFNPAVAISLDVTSWDHFGNCLWYTLFELAGALLAAFLFSKVRPTDFGNPSSKQAEELLSEFLGTFVLVLTVSCNVLAGSAAAALSIAASLSAMIYALGDVSGAHFNPAVSCAVYFSGRDAGFTGTKACFYATAQVVGGILAGLIAMGVFGSSAALSFGPKAPFHLSQAMAAEFFFTFNLSFVVLAVAVSALTKTSHFFGLAIGFCVVVGGFACGSVSGGALNPAVALGLAVSGGGVANALAYAAAQLLAGGAAAGVFKVTHQAELESPEAKSVSSP